MLSLADRLDQDRLMPGAFIPRLSDGEVFFVATWG
jgi:hypothetical protein